MERLINKLSETPSITRYTSTHNAGIECVNLQRNAIGYIIRGEKLIYNGDQSLHVSRGDVFFLGQGTHYVENIALSGANFEQVIVYYSSEDLKKVITSMSLNYNISFTNSHICNACQRSNSIVIPASKSLTNYFATLSNYINDGELSHNPAAEGIKLTELVYMILTGDENCLKNRVFNSIDTSKNTFEQIIYSHIFSDISVDDLASLCNRSLTSFKKEFKRLFDYPPHQWFLRQRLNYSRMLLETTRKSISEIGVECTFPNTSHFIKLFKKFYGHTPASYRAHQISSQKEQVHDVAS